MAESEEEPRLERVIDPHRFGGLLYAERRRSRGSMREASRWVRGASVTERTSRLHDWEGGEQLPEQGELVSYLEHLGASVNTRLLLVECLRLAAGAAPLSVRQRDQLLELAVRQLQAGPLPKPSERYQWRLELLTLELRIERLENEMGWAEPDEEDEKGAFAP